MATTEEKQRILDYTMLGEQALMKAGLPYTPTREVVRVVLRDGMYLYGHRRVHYHDSKDNKISFDGFELNERPNTMMLNEPVQETIGRYLGMVRPRSGPKRYVMVNAHAGGMAYGLPTFGSFRTTGAVLVPLFAIADVQRLDEPRG